MTVTPESHAQVADTTDLFGHPRGLLTLAGTELWERISFHGMVALLTLYMAEQLLLPGHIEHIAGFPAYRRLIEAVTGPLSVQGLATQTFGMYIGLIYFTPVIGGWIGDRWLGRRNAVITGCLLMTLGHFCMAFDQSFLVALAALIVGAGFLRGNLIAQVGQLYGAGDLRVTHAIQIYYAMVNVGGFVAPLITGALSQNYGWHYGFGFAGGGMLVGMIVYVLGAKYVPQPRHSEPATQTRRPMTPEERRTAATLIALVPVLTLYWVTNTQEWNVYNLWARDHVNMVFFGWHMPVPWVQSLASVLCVMLVPVVLLVWRRLAARGMEPDDVGKIGIGCLIVAAFTVGDALSTTVFGGANAVPFVWILITNVGISFGYLHVQPVSIALFARTAPPAVKGAMVGVYFLSIFFGGLISGRLGSLYEHWSATQFWMLHAGTAAAAGVLVPVVGRSLRERAVRAGDRVVVDAA